MRKQSKKYEKRKNTKENIYKKKIGLPPGTPVYTGNIKPSEDIVIQSISYNSSECNYKEATSMNNIQMKNNGITWLNINGIHQVELIKEIALEKEIDSLIVEDIVSINQRPKIDRRKDYIYITLKMMSIKNGEEDIFNSRTEIEQVSIIVGKNYLLTFQEKKGDMFNDIRERIIKNQGKIREKGSDYLAYELIDSIVDDYFLIVENFEEKIEVLEEKLLIAYDNSDLEKIMKVKKEFVEIRRNITLVGDIVAKIGNGTFNEMELFGSNMKYYIQDLHDHTSRLEDILEIITGVSHSLVDLYHSAQNKKINDIMKIFTIITTIFVPLSFITGIYGMNFEKMPFLKNESSFEITIASMFFIAVGMLYIFKRKKWI